MLRLRFWMAALFLGGALSANVFAQESSLTPEQVMDLYLRVFVNNDLESAKKVNDYLRPEYSGQDALNIEAIRARRANIQEVLTTNFLEGVPPTSRKQLEPVTNAFFAEMLRTVYRSECRSVGHELRQNKYIEGQMIASVEYVCKLPSVKLDMDGLEKLKQSKPLDIKKIEQVLHSMTASLAAAPLTKEVKDKKDLYNSDDKQRWYNGSPEEVLQTVTTALDNQ